MPTTVAIRFPWGRYHGTPWGRNVNEGVVDWPPEPWRLLRALYATWRSRSPELSEELVAELLDTLADPPGYTVPPHRVAHTRHWYPDAKHGTRGGGTDKVFDTFAVVPRDADLRITWPATLEPRQRDALAVLCDRLTYLGRADSICAARLVEDQQPDDPAPDHRRIEPVTETGDPTGSGPAVHHVLAGERPLRLDALEVRPQAMRKQGRLEPPGSRRIPYPTLPQIEPVASPTRPQRRWPHPTAVRFRITAKARPAPEAALAMTDALRQAAVAKFDPVGTGRESVTLFGKDRRGARVDTGHQHAHYLALSTDDDHRLLDTLVVWAPEGLEDSEIDALARINELRGYRFVADFRPCRLAVEAVGAVADIAPELTHRRSRGTGSAGSRTWHSVTPYAPPRNVRRQPTWEAHAEAYLHRDLRAAGLPDARVEPRRQDRWLSHRRHRVTEKLRDARRATGFTLTFDQEVDGPVCLGALRHLGLGLFLPEDT